MATNPKPIHSEEFIVIAAIGILLILFIPIPPALLDVLLVINFSWALAILLLTFYTDKPLSFSTFPALLLISTLFRLALNISATRLILSDGHAGQIIQSIGHYVIHDNYVMGLVVFLILIIVQFIVVTNGSQRVAEVAARFILDSMPGKQMSIDADLNMGLIPQEEAKKRRAQLEKEANFYGAMDGASKFVKGDAIAGILIILVDIIGGFAIGIAQKGLSLTQSIQTYTLLTVGDGLITQIPALIISTATGIIVTRAATDAELGSEVIRQIAAYPKTLVMVCLGLSGLLFLKGIPILPVISILAVLALLTWYAFRAKHQENDEPAEKSIYEKIKIYPVEIVLNPELYNQLQTQEFEILSHINEMRERIAFDLGFVLPEIKFRADPKIGYPFYGIAIEGHVSSRYHQLHVDKRLALNIHNGSNQNLVKSGGIEVRDPGYSLPAVWISVNQCTNAEKEGFKLNHPLSVLMTHLNETILQHMAELLSRDETERLLSQVEIKKMADELVPGLLPLSHVQRILQNLLQEKVSIRYIRQILEVLLEHAKNLNDLTQLTELVRSRLALSICQKLLSAQNKLYVLTLELSLEQKLNQSIHQNIFSPEPEITEKILTSLMQQVEQMLNERKRPILLCSAILRKHLKNLTHRILPHLTVLGMNEIPVNIQVESFGIIK
ncbi:flagellar biosynthesis protein FlhA [Legionella israelensis]|uniref:Flagellar biosynthesis protein FlhA n=1 Tax=Legionella israelensis TaxID=454 RepID=A0A0W0VYB3_9GAMM|nr:flagellar biosynthesis protein FlhA [Legionella israelensis]KTD24989.1 flagellar biosynthesis protein FlhA [Legionella israelensis]QBS10885.1 flagellar type III secretion system protein FlhA [Legionella israelensis]SCX80442.1 flagellar biosynthesis protein FlhA [Legionella israelensis DSM 19235]STX57869.1 flagellar biosynthesis protein FlhA [Legionella israelensis]